MKSLIAPLVLFLSVSLASIAVVSCAGTNCKDPANATSAKCTAVNAVVSCGGASLDQLVAEELPQFGKDIAAAIQSDGSINYAAAVPVLESYATKFGMCFVTQIMTKIGTLQLAAAPGAPASPHATPKALADTLETFRATHYTGTKFELAAGSGSGSGS